MSNVLLAFLLNVFLVFQSCETIPIDKGNAATGQPQRVTSGGCDFSEFAPVRIQHFDSDAVVKRVQPALPVIAVQRGLQGSVVVKALVNDKGEVAKACATTGAAELRGPAERAALKWRFKPGYGLAFSRPETNQNPRNYAEVFIVFDFKLPVEE